ncbi:MAG: nucleotidyltransferase [Pseudomonadota bacterium]
MKIEKLLKLLNEKQIKFAIVGAYACAAHGYVRATADIDILIDPSEENIDRLRAALEEFGYRTHAASLEDFKTKKILFRQYWLDTDIHPFVDGVKTDDALKNRIKGDCEGVKTYFVSLNDLIRMKRAAGRPKDIEDLRYLEEIRRQKKKK